MRWNQGEARRRGSNTIGLVAVSGAAVIGSVLGAAHAGAETDPYVSPPPSVLGVHATPPPAQVLGSVQSRDEAPALPRGDIAGLALTGGDIGGLALIGAGALTGGAVLVRRSRTGRRS